MSAAVTAKHLQYRRHDMVFQVNGFYSRASKTIPCMEPFLDALELEMLRFAVRLHHSCEEVGVITSL